PAQPRQAGAAAHREGESADRRPRLPLSARLGSRLSPTALGYLFAIAAAAFYAVGGVIAKRAFDLGVPPETLAEWRILFAFLVFLAMTLAFKRADLRAVRRRDLPLLAAFGLLGVLAVQLVYYEA